MRKKDLDLLIFRWKSTTRSLEMHDQPYAKRITDILEQCTDADLARFTDPVEAAAFFCLLDLAGAVSDRTSPARQVTGPCQVHLSPERFHS